MSFVQGFTQELVGNLLDYKEPNHVIVQQCNTLTVYGHGLSEAIFKTYPYADIYTTRRAVGKRNLAIQEDRPTMGECLLRFPSSKCLGPIVANLIAQKCPSYIGKPYPTFDSDGKTAIVETQEERRTAFVHSLKLLGEQIRLLNKQEEYSKNPIKNVYFPAEIGCGLACAPRFRKQQWIEYRKYITEFSEQYKNDFQVYIVKLAQ